MLDEFNKSLEVPAGGSNPAPFLDDTWDADHGLVFVLDTTIERY